MFEKNLEKFVNILQTKLNMLKTSKKIVRIFC
jgi:hypothetical protein